MSGQKETEIAEEFSFSIPLNAINDSFICPICLNGITDCHITSCGHLFCEKCIRECLNRRHICPLCNAETTQERLVKNHAYDILYSKILAEKEKSAKAYMDSLMKQAKTVKKKPGVEETESTPIEAVFQKHVRRSLLAYEEYYRELENEFQAEKAALRVKHKDAIDELRGKVSVELKLNGEEDSQSDALMGGGLAVPGGLSLPPLNRSVSAENAAKTAQELTAKLKEDEGLLTARFNKAVALLVDSYDQYMSNIAPSAFLLPVKCTLVIGGGAGGPGGGGGGIKLDMALRSTDSFHALKKIVVDKTAALGANAVTGFGDKVTIYIKRPFAGEQAEEKLQEVADWNQTVADLKLTQGTEIHVKGNLILKGDDDAVCFTATYVKDGEQRIDYFRCKDCNCNWICKPCANTCHKGHTLVTFMLNHKPSYGCCYCVKKKTCKLMNAKSKKP